jgi:hypothetical protein
MSKQPTTPHHTATVDNIDLTLLQKQKYVLVMMDLSFRPQPQKDAVEGIINLLDAIQDNITEGWSEQEANDHLHLYTVDCGEDPMGIEPTFSLKELIQKNSEDGAEPLPDELIAAIRALEPNETVDPIMGAHITRVF